MALEYAHGSFVWAAADVVTTLKTVSGLSFQPKAIRLYWQGMSSTTDAASETLSSRRGVGFATSTSNRMCVSTQDNDAAPAMVTRTGIFNDGVAYSSNGGSGNDGELDVSSFNADGFSLIVDFQATVDLEIFWEAWGGSDITVANVQLITEPAATGDVDYTVTGFVAGAPDQVVMFAGVQQTNTPPIGGVGDSGLCVGFASGGNAADNVVVLGNSDEGAANSDTDGYCKTGECLAMIAVAGGNPDARAQLTQFGTDNFRLNWIARATTGRNYIALAIKGGRWKAGSYTINANTGGATATVSGLAFTPIGLSLIGRGTAEQAAGTSSAEDRMSLGSGSSTSSRRSQGHLSEDSQGAAEIDLVIEYDQVLAFPSATGTLVSAYDINAMNADGFQIIVDVAGGLSGEWQGYLAFGTPPANPVVAHTVAQSTDGNAITTAEIDTTGATLLVMVVAIQSGAAANPLDSKSNTWVAMAAGGGANNPNLKSYYVKNPTVGTGHTFTAGSASSFVSVAVAAIGGTDTTADRDQENVGASVGAPTQATGSVTPTVDNEVLVSGFAYGTTNVPTIDGGFTVLESGVFQPGLAYAVGLAYLVQTTAAAANPTWTAGGAANVVAGIDTFKAAAAVVSPRMIFQSGVLTALAPFGYL